MNNFKRKQWARIGLSLVAVAVAVLFLTGIIGGKPMTYQIGVNENAVSAAEKGFGGDVTVHLELEGKKVKSLTIDTPDETEGLGKRASDKEFTDQFVGKEGPFTFGENGIDALSGATVTSNAALKAINVLITGEKPAETAKPAATEAPAAETEKTAETEKPAEAADEPKMSAMASEQGFGGKVTVRVETDLDQVIKALTVETPDETEGIGKRVSEAAFTDQFIGKTGPFTFGENGIEAVSGATVTSTAALKALNRTYAAEEIQEEAEKPAETEKPAEEEKPAETEKPADAADTLIMSAMAWEQGFGGQVSVRVETDLDQVIKALIVETPDETEGIGKRVSEPAFTDQFIGKTGPFTFGENGIEAVSGATVTSTAALKALNRTFGAEEPAEEAKPAETEAPAAEPAEAPAVKEESAKAPAAYGSYLSVKETDFSTIRVIVTTRNGVLTDCRIRSEAKSAGSDFLTDEIKAAWAKAIVENQSADTDAISGATLKFSAGAVKEAVAEILEKIQGK